MILNDIKNSIVHLYNFLIDNNLYAIVNEVNLKKQIALVHFADGRKGLKVLPRIRQRIVAYHTTMLRDNRIIRIDLFISNDPYFNRFPNSSAFNVSLAKEEEFIPHIEQAEPLKL